jgi:hypothetical protein
MGRVEEVGWWLGGGGAAAAATAHISTWAEKLLPRTVTMRPSTPMPTMKVRTETILPAHVTG